jgi:hypothetical protein
MTSLSLNKELISSFPINIDPLIATKRVLWEQLKICQNFLFHRLIGISSFFKWSCS